MACRVFFFKRLNKTQTQGATDILVVERPEVRLGNVMVKDQKSRIPETCGYVRVRRKSGLMMMRGGSPDTWGPQQTRSVDNLISISLGAINPVDDFLDRLLDPLCAHKVLLEGSLS